MANIWQVSWAWTGFPGSTGYTNLHFQATSGNAVECQDAVGKSLTLFDYMKSALPPTVRLDHVTDVRLLRDTDGQLQNIFTVTGVGGVTGTGPSQGYSAASGACIDWLTGAVHGRHMLTGKTFVVPLAGSQYEDNGSLTSSCVLTLATAAETFRTSAGPQFGVWGRPRKANPSKVPPVTAMDGAWHAAISSRIPDKAAVLRSRRD